MAGGWVLGSLVILSLLATSVPAEAASVPAIAVEGHLLYALGNPPVILVPIQVSASRGDDGSVTGVVSWTTATTSSGWNGNWTVVELVPPGAANYWCLKLIPVVVNGIALHSPTILLIQDVGNGLKRLDRVLFENIWFDPYRTCGQVPFDYCDVHCGPATAGDIVTVIIP